MRLRKHTTQDTDITQKKEFEFERESGFSPLRDTSEPEFFQEISTKSPFSVGKKEKKA